MRKFYSLFCAACAFHIQVQSQQLPSLSLSNEDPDWAGLMKHSDADFFDIISQHKSSWPQLPTTPGQGYKPFARWQYLMSMRVDENGNMPSGEQIIHQWEEIKNYQANRSLEGNWQQLGPILDDVTTRDNIEGVGRTTAIAFHPTDPNTIYLGTPAGGLWKSTNGGTTWTTDTDDLPTLGVSAIAIDSNNPDVIYIGTGDRDASDAPGMGVMKTIDSGESWEFLNSGIENLTVGAIRLLLNNVIVIATSEGIYRSVDGGESWAMTSGNSVDYRDLEVHPTNPDILYASGGGKFFRSIDGGQSWDWIQEGIQNGSRMVIAVTPLNPDFVYVLRSNTYEYRGLYRSTDAGVTFVEMSDEPNILGWAADGSSDGGQAWYDLCLEADHETTDVLYAGGIRIKKSIDGGVTWTDLNSNYLHVDQHELVISPHNLDIYLANDGGVYHYVDNSEWLDISNNLVNGQIYRLGQSPHQPNKTLTGFQDNGTSEFNGAFWQKRGGGDGFECAYDITDESWRYGSVYYGALYRTSPDFVNQKFCGFEVNEITEEGAWSTPYILHPTDPNTMFVGLKNIWRSFNIKDAEVDSIHWKKISSNLGGNDLSNLNAVEISAANHNILFAAEPNQKLFRTTNCMADSVLWTNISSGLPTAYSPVRSIETDPADSNLVYIAFHQNAYKSIDMGATWVDITPELPDVIMNTIVLDTSGAEEALYIGTDMGIYYKDATMIDWVPFNSGFPLNARVTELEIYYGATHEESRLKAATYGRGLWESDLYGGETITFPPQALLVHNDETTEIFGDFSTTLTFHRSLDYVEMDGVIANDIWADNATLFSMTEDPGTFGKVFYFTPTTYGEVKIYFGDSLATDADGIPNLASDTLTLYYSAPPEPFGITGPGGVGDNTQITFWLRADGETFGNNNTVAYDDGDFVEEWRDKLGGPYFGLQGNEDNKPTIGLGENGISNRAALYFDGENDWLEMFDVVPGRSISGYAMVEADSIAWNDHGWIASARMPNGYLMHPWKEESRYSAEVFDLDDNYLGGPIYYIEDAAAPRMYGFIYHQDDFHQTFHTVFDDQVMPFPGADIGLRDNTTSIDVHIGWDYEERFGQGKIAEHFIYNQRLMTSHNTIVANYMASRYLTDIGPLSKYDHPGQPNEVFGIGKETHYDLHTDAKGPGIIRITDDLDVPEPYYLLMGDDEGSLDMTTDSYPIVSSRTERTWGYTETGTNGDIYVRVEKESFIGLSGLGLIISESDEFVPGESVGFIPLTENGDYLEAYVDFNESGVFTIGTTPEVSVLNPDFIEMNVFPNPAFDVLNIHLSNAGNSACSLQLMDATGRIVLAENFAARKTALDLSEFSHGIYTLRVEVQGKTFYRKVVKR